jgi:uncharacterized protein YjbJ (UPF0337 family)
VRGCEQPDPVGCRVSTPSLSKVDLQASSEPKTQEPFGASVIVPPRSQDAKEIMMGSTTDKIKGAANEAIGKAKQGIGEATGSEKLQGEGVIQEGKGHGQQALGDAKEATKDAADKTAGFVNKKL